MLKREVVENVRENVEFGALVGRYTRLDGNEPSLKGVCPFHSDNDPSLYVNTEQKVFYCHGCHEGGDLFQFLMKAESLNFEQAVYWLGSEFGAPVDAEDIFKPDKTLDKLSAEHRTAGKSLHSKEGERALRYLMSERSFSSEAITAYEIGYGGRDSNGMFRARVMFPIKDQLNRVIGFGGRTLNGGPKYVNSRNNKYYDKSKCLFGLPVAKKNRTADKVYIVEGYLDVLRLYEAGLTTCVSTCGTALTKEQARLVAKHWRHAVLMLDGDSAGRAATLRAIPILYGQKTQVSVCPLPDGKDPADCTPEELRVLPLVSGWEFMIDKTPTTPGEAVAFLKPMLRYLSHSERYEVWQKLGARLGLPQSMFTLSSKWEMPTEDRAKLLDPNVEAVLSLLIHKPEWSTALSGLHAEDMPIGWIKEAFSRLSDGEHVTEIIRGDDGEMATALSRIAASVPGHDIVESARQGSCNLAIQSLTRLVWEANSSGNTEQLVLLAQRRQGLIDLKNS